MQRRTFLTGATTSASLLTLPNIVRAAQAGTLHYVPQADLTVIDPVMTTAYITRYHATMVWDQFTASTATFSRSRRWWKAISRGGWPALDLHIARPTTLS